MSHLALKRYMSKLSQVRAVLVPESFFWQILLGGTSQIIRAIQRLSWMQCRRYLVYAALFLIIFFILIREGTIRLFLL